MYKFCFCYPLLLFCIVYRSLLPTRYHVPDLLLEGIRCLDRCSLGFNNAIAVTW